jgi:dihydroorotate dehydrogenase
MYPLLTWFLHKLPPEAAHHAAIKLLRIFPVENVAHNIDTRLLAQELMGLYFSHPLGLAAGFDKDAEVFDKLGQIGFSFVEIGSVTPRPQPGNPKPRLFRLTEQQAIINRYGFNSQGLDCVAENLQRYPRTCITGINLGKNKETVEAIDDFLLGAEKLAAQANYFVINVSSPNTPGLRDLQNPIVLEPIIDGIKKLSAVPLLVKISPDMTIEQESALIEFLVKKNIDGIIVSNTTVSRAGVKSTETGGLSGPPLYELSTVVLKRVYRITQGRIVLIGCGGISSGQDAYEKLCAGADLLQFYTAFIYQGPQVIRRILLELKALFERDGIKNIREIIGSKV